MKKLIMFLTVSCLLGLFGCAHSKKVTPKKESTPKNAKVMKEIHAKEETVVINGLKMKLAYDGKTRTLDKKNKVRELYSYHVLAENMTEEAKGIGAIDFIAENSNQKKVDISSEFKAFGKSLKGKEKFTFDLKFIVQPGSKITNISYSPDNTKKLATWQLED